MKRYVIEDEASKYTRISKHEARKRFDAGESFYIIGHKMRPGFPFGLGMTIFPLKWQEENRTFDDMIRYHVHYNTSHEEGYYAAFYVVTDGKQDSE